MTAREDAKENGRNVEGWAGKVGVTTSSKHLPWSCSQMTKKMGDIGARWGRSSVRNPGLTACNWLLQRPVPHKPAGRTRSAGAFGVQSDVVDFSTGAPPIARLPAYQRSGPMAGRANQHAGMVTVNQPSLDSARRTSGDLWRHYGGFCFLFPDFNCCKNTARRDQDMGRQ